MTWIRIETGNDGQTLCRCGIPLGDGHKCTVAMTTHVQVEVSADPLGDIERAICHIRAHPDYRAPVPSIFDLIFHPRMRMF